MDDTDATLCRAVHCLLAGEGALQLRLLCVASDITTLRPDDFPPELRGQVVRLRADFSMLGLAGGYEDGRQHRDLNNHDATTLALRVLAVAFGLAVKEPTE